jgi:2',3'-cyclic-nucleotide 2'-phosphodiesterase
MIRQNQRMNLLFFGDVVGRSGRDAVVTHLPELKKRWAIDVAIVNGENAAGGYGISGEIYEQFIAAGADIVTGGDHIWDQKDLLTRMDQERKLLRPANYPDSTPGHGVAELKTPRGKTVVVIHLQGQVFMKDYLDNPFAAADRILQRYKLGANCHAIVVDFHAEATSEKCAMGHFLDGRVSLVVGSHTHIPTADARILPGGTAYQTDAGMCGDYNSVIGFEPQGPLAQFISKRRTGRMTAASGEATLCGLRVGLDDATGLATSIERVAEGGVLG